MRVFEIQNPDFLNSWHRMQNLASVRRTGAHSHVVEVTFSAL